MGLWGELMASLIDFSDDAVAYSPFALLDTASNGLLGASDYVSTNLPIIDGFDKALWVLSVGAMASDETLDCAIYWASDAIASNAVNTSSTDAVFVQLDSDSGGMTYLLTMDLHRMGMETGLLVPIVAIHGTIIFSLTCFMYGGNGARPVTQQQTVVNAVG